MGTACLGPQVVQREHTLHQSLAPLLRCPQQAAFPLSGEAGFALSVEKTSLGCQAGRVNRRGLNVKEWSCLSKS